MEAEAVAVEEEDNVDTESKHSSTGSIGAPPAKELRQEKLDSYLSLLERDQQHLNTLMVLKEKEWDAILKLKKLKEIKIARLQRQREVEDLLSLEDRGGDQVPPKRRRSRADSFKLDNNTGEGSVEVANKREVEARNNIHALEKEVNDLAAEVFMDNSQDFDGHLGLESQDEGAFLASNALKSLVKNNRTSGTSQSPSASAKVVGEGRQGPKVDVTTLIADYRYVHKYEITYIKHT